MGWRIGQSPPLAVDSSPPSNIELPLGIKAKNCEQVGKTSELIHNHVIKQCATSQTFPLILGGDHCIAIGTIAAIKSMKKDAGIVWVCIFSSIHNDID